MYSANIFLYEQCGRMDVTLFIQYTVETETQMDGEKPC